MIFTGEPVIPKDFVHAPAPGEPKMPKFSASKLVKPTHKKRMELKRRYQEAYAMWRKADEHARVEQWELKIDRGEA